MRHLSSQEYRDGSKLKAERVNSGVTATEAASCVGLDLECFLEIEFGIGSFNDIQKLKLKKYYRHRSEL